MEYNFKRVHTVKDLSISTIVLLAGIGLFFVSKGLGISVAVFGLLRFLIYKGGYKRNGCVVVLTKKSEDLCKACKFSIAGFLAGKDIKQFFKAFTEGGLTYTTTVQIA